MGYSTDFSGAFQVKPPLKPEHSAYLRKFAATRRMKRDAKLAEALPDPLRLAVGLPIGDEGAYYVGGSEHDCSEDASVLDGNCAPGAIGYRDPRPWEERKRAEAELYAAFAAQPGLWCQWVPAPDNDGIEWDGGEKFYNYVEWLGYLIHHFLSPWGYTLNGEVAWNGDSSDDHGVIYVRDNVVEAVADTNPGPSWGK